VTGATRRPPLRFRSSSETYHCSPAPQRRADDPKVDERLVPRCCLSWGFVPYDTVPDRRIRMKATDPSATACHVRGLGTSFAASTTGPPGARSAGASMGFTLQGVLLVRERCPSRGPCPPDVAGHPPPRRETRGTGRLQGLIPATSSCCHRVPRNSAVDAFLGFSPTERSPHPPGPSLVVTMPALSPFSGMTSLPAWATGLRGSNGSAWSVSGLPALLGFRTFRPSRRSVPRSGELAYGFASRRTPHPKARHQLRSRLPR
jgi:hypothetical protein